MPDGRTHTALNLGVLVGASLVAVGLGVPAGAPPLVAVAVGALVGTLLVTPDLDMLHVRVDARRHWGRLGWIWYPLLLVSKHRGVSHSYFRGPLIRAVYLCAVLWLLGHLLMAGLGAVGLEVLPARLWQALTGWSWLSRTARLLALPGPSWALLGWAALGYWLAQVCHLAADRIPLEWRRL